MELLIAVALGALVVITAANVRKYFSENAGDNIRAIIDMPTDRLRKVLRRSSLVHKERPRVVVSGPKIKPIVCQICLGRVKEGLEYARCDCGKVFHPVCLIRTGFCPYCQREYSAETLAEGNVIRPRNRVEPKRNSSGITMLWQSDSLHVCPVCGLDLPEGGNECSCGTVIVGDEETFECPSCGCEVPPRSMECPECREQFGVLEEPPCPFCGRPMAEGELCPCGAMVGDACPECGFTLGSSETYCGNCGAAFEFL